MTFWMPRSNMIKFPLRPLSPSLSEHTEHVSVFQFQDGVWTLSTTICDGLMTMDVMLCTASIFNLCAISIDRLVLTPVHKHTNSTAKLQQGNSW